SFPFSSPDMPPFISQPFSNLFVSPEMVSFLQMIPLPNHAAITNNFSASGTESLNSDQFSLRFDFNPNPRLTIFSRYTSADFRQDGTPAFGVVGGPGTNPDFFAGRGRTRNLNFSAGFSYALRPSVLVDFRFGTLGYDVHFRSLDEGTEPATKAGI